MSDTATQIQEPIQNEPVAAQPNVNEQIANALWDGIPVKQQEPIVNTPAAVEVPIPDAVTDDNADQILELDDYFKREFGVDAETAKSKWETLSKLEQIPPAPQEVQYANEESKRIHDLIKAGKTEEVYNALHQQMQLNRLEQYDINNVNQAAEIIKANLQFKHKELSTQQIDRLFDRQYKMPVKPTQGPDQDDTDFAVELEGWQREVQEKEQDMIIDATLAKPELTKHKSQIVFPDIPQVPNTQEQPNQKELEEQQLALIENFKKTLEKDYQNFKGFSVTAIDGDVQLPISYTVSPEEVAASKDFIANFNMNDFFDQRWLDKQGNPNINQIQEDLYLLMNKDKVFQKIANEASAQRLLHHQKIQNNIKLNGVNQELLPNAQTAKTQDQAVAEAIWSM